MSFFSFCPLFFDFLQREKKRKKKKKKKKKKEKKKKRRRERLKKKIPPVLPLAAFSPVARARLPYYFPKTKVVVLPARTDF